MSKLMTTDLTPPSSSPTITLTTDKMYTTCGPTISTTGGYSTYDPFVCTTSATSSPTYTVTWDDITSLYAPKGATKEEVEEITKKVDKHVDELEEDIDFLSNKLEVQTSKLDNTYTDVEELISHINSLEILLNNERTTVANLENKLKWTTNILNALIKKLDMHMEDLIC